MTTLAVLSLLIWLYLLTAHGRFWQSAPELPAGRAAAAPAVAVVVPARDEAAHIAASLGSLLDQEYAGPLRIILVDDASSDGTGTIARGLADPRLTVLDGRPRPAGWSGKLWAIAQGLAEANDAELVLLSDADIVHGRGHLTALVAEAERRDLDLVSEMVALNCESPAEHALVPAFVFFFQLLYPFAWVNDPLRATAAAAGGTVLIRRRALERIGGIAVVRGALIDDVALATLLKRDGNRCWLGLTTDVRSARPYPRLAALWHMIARSAYTQLRYSPALLAGTIAGLLLLYAAPPAGVIAWLAAPGGAAAAAAGVAGLTGWALMTVSFLPMLRLYRLSPLRAPSLPLIALLYAAMTADSARRHYAGRTVSWRGRAAERV